MKLLLVTTDETLSKTCRELVNATSGDWTYSTCDPQEYIPAADLCLWDFGPRFVPPIKLSGTARHLFLAHVEDVHPLRNWLGLEDVDILLKPVTQAVLATYLRIAASSRQSSEIDKNALRADRDQILQSLIEANFRLQEYDQERTHFLERAIHDFRAPLTALSGYCGLLLSGALGEVKTEQVEVIQRMQQSTGRLSRLANGMFELGISRRAQRIPEFGHANLEECLERARVETANFLRDKKASLEVEMSPTPPSLYFDASQIERVLINLLDNACKFVPRGGTIEIKGYPCSVGRREIRQITPISRETQSETHDELNTYRVDVLDSGSSIPQDQLDCVFEEFVSSGSRQDRSGGGLGLAICRFIIQQHGGCIWAANTEAGPMFSFTLPLSATYGSGNRSNQETALMEA